MLPADAPNQTIHASCVALGVSAVLIMGTSGAGKSALALQLMSLGAVLVADDRTILASTDAGITARCPAAITGKIEARGVGLLLAEFQASAVVRLVVDLDQIETDRLPHMREIELMGHSIPLLHATNGPHFAPAILQLLKGGRMQ